MSEAGYGNVPTSEFSKENTGYSRKFYFSDFKGSPCSLDKSAITELINMMFRFQTRTGCPFKIEEYLDAVFVLTDLNKICSIDVDNFFRRNRDIAHKIWFSSIPNNKHILNIYEDCFKNRDIKDAPYIKSYCLEDIIKRPKSVSFILDS